MLALPFPSILFYHVDVFGVFFSFCLPPLFFFAETIVSSTFPHYRNV